MDEEAALRGAIRHSPIDNQHVCRVVLQATSHFGDIRTARVNRPSAERQLDDDTERHGANGLATE